MRYTEVKKCPKFHNMIRRYTETERGNRPKNNYIFRTKNKDNLENDFPSANVC